MRISESQTDRQSLIRFGEEAVALLRDSDFVALAERFGYALAHGREPAMALEVDFAASQSGESEAHEHATPSMEIKYFNGEATESTGLVAAVECVTHLADGSPVLIALVVTGKGSERYITVEGIDRI